MPLRDDREDLTLAERMNKIEVAVSALDANFNHLMWVIEHAMLQRRDHVDELLQNQALKQAKDVRKLKALEEEYRMDVEDHLEEKIAQLEEQLAGHANWAAAHAEHKSFAETHERFEEAREMTPAGGYPSFLLWVVVLLCVEIDQCIGCNAAVLAPSSGSPRHRAGVASMAWRSTRRFGAVKF